MRADALGFMRQGDNLIPDDGEQRIFKRTAVIAFAIDARKKHHPQETPFRYRPFAGLEDQYRLTEETFERAIRDNNLKALAI